MNIEMGQEAGPYIVSMFIHFSVQLFATPWTVVFSVYEILQARILDLVTMLFSRGSSHPRDQIFLSCISYITGRFFT